MSDEDDNLPSDCEPETPISSLDMSEEDVIMIRETARFHNWPSFDKVLPIVCDNGYTLSSVMVHCATCQTEIYTANIHGEARKVIGGDYRLTGYAMCYRCKSLTPILIHMRQEDGTDKVFFDKIKRPDYIPADGAKVLTFGKKEKRRGKKIVQASSNTGGSEG